MYAVNFKLYLGYIVADRYHKWKS